MTPQLSQLLASDGNEFLAVCSRANSRAHPGEFDILGIKIGPRNSQYSVTVSWNKPQQQELLPE